MSSLLMVRMMASMLPEEFLLDKVIGELEEYRALITKEESPQEGVSYDEIQESLLGIANKEVDAKIEKPIAALQTLMTKWQDAGKSQEDIIKESALIQEQIEKMNG